MPSKKYVPTPEELDGTAIHEAGHAVLQIALGLGCSGVTVVADFKDMSAGASLRGRDWQTQEEWERGEVNDAEELRTYAEDAFWLRTATSYYAGAEAVRQLRPAYDPQRREAGAEGDYRQAVDAINQISDDAQTIDLYFALAKRRCAVLVEHYAPEIETMARALKQQRSLSGDDARKIFRDPLLARRASLLTW